MNKQQTAQEIVQLAREAVKHQGTAKGDQLAKRVVQAAPGAYSAAEAIARNPGTVMVYKDSGRSTYEVTLVFPSREEEFRVDEKEWKIVGLALKQNRYKHDRSYGSISPMLELDLRFT